MDFELSDDQLALRDAAAGLLDDHASPVRVRNVVDERATHDEKLWAAMIEQGWLGVELPESAGGLEMGFVEVAVLLEEVGRHAAPAPFGPTVLALGALRGTDWEDRLINGAVGSVVWHEGDGRVLVPYGPIADVVVVVGSDGLTVHDLTAGDPVAAEPAMDVTRCIGWLATDRPGAVRLDGDVSRVTTIDRGAAAYAAESLGGAARVLDLTVEHAKTREQFGQPIGSFQAVKHRCADMLVDVEGMRSTAYHAAWSIAADDAGASVSASTAKVWCADASQRVMASGLQVHGGIGFTWEHDLHFYLKRAQLDRQSFGGATVHRERLAQLLRPRAEAGESIV